MQYLARKDYVGASPNIYRGVYGCKEILKVVKEMKKQSGARIKKKKKSFKLIKYSIYI